MSKTKLIPKIDTYIEQELNVLLIGRHGVGKTYTLLEAAERHGLTLKYFSCSTLDPFTDLVGVPYPDDDREDLKMVRPRSIDEADIIMFDELNRAADTKTLNAIFEIVQFRSINGEKLKAKSVWAAINPVDDKGTYNVHDLDPALIDRFDVYEFVKPQVNVTYLTDIGVDRKIAMALKEWYDKASKDEPSERYMSPRRVEKIARLVQSTGDTSIVRRCMPPGSKFSVNELIAALNVALGKKTDPVGGLMGGPPDPSMKYNVDWLRNQASTVIKKISAPDATEATIDSVIKCFESGVGPDLLAADPIVKILDACPVSKTEAMVKGWNASKRSRFKSAITASSLNLKNLPKIFDS